MSDNHVSDTEKVKVEKVTVTPYSKPWDDSDAVIICGYDQFHVHKLILGMASPVLKKMFRISKEEGKNQVEIPGKYQDIVITVLNMIYPGKHAIPDKAVIELVLLIAKEYEIVVIDQIIDRDLSLTRFESRKLFLAEKFDLKLTRTACLEQLEANDYVLSDHIGLREMNRETLSQVILFVVDILWKRVKSCRGGHTGNQFKRCKNCHIQFEMKGSVYHTIDSWINLYNKMKQEKNE